MAKPINRRDLIAGTAAVGAALAALPLTHGAIALQAVSRTDAALEAAWQRRIEALDAYDLVMVNGDTPEEEALEDAWAREETLITNTIAETPHGLAIQLWLALEGSVSNRVDHEATKHRDLAHFEDNDSQLDWDERIILSALRSLHRQSAA